MKLIFTFTAMTLENPLVQIPAPTMRAHTYRERERERETKNFKERGRNEGKKTHPSLGTPSNPNP